MTSSPPWVSPGLRQAVGVKGHKCDVASPLGTHVAKVPDPIAVELLVIIVDE